VATYERKLLGDLQGPGPPDAFTRRLEADAAAT